MSRHYEIPGTGVLEIEYLLLDVNGTLTDRGELIEGVAERLARIREAIEVHLLSADTFGTLDALAAELGVHGELVAHGGEKSEFVEQLSSDACAAIGNGRNDTKMFAASRLSIAVIGPEGASGVAVREADLICRSIVDALDLLLDDKALAASLRA